MTLPLLLRSKIYRRLGLRFEAYRGRRSVDDREIDGRRSGELLGVIHLSSLPDRNSQTRSGNLFLRLLAQSEIPD